MPTEEAANNSYVKLTQAWPITGALADRRVSIDSSGLAALPDDAAVNSSGLGARSCRSVRICDKTYSDDKEENKFEI